MKVRMELSERLGGDLAQIASDHKSSLKDVILVALEMYATEMVHNGNILGALESMQDISDLCSSVEKKMDEEDRVAAWSFFKKMKIK